MNGNYEKALKTYDQAIQEVNENYPYRFWKATLLQDLEKFEKAIPEYAKVIEHGNNTFIEEAEWYKSYCYIKLEDWENAKEQLLAIIERKGFYENDARAILRRIKYSLK
jgi:tetratricopeptide (TPR) repeat protein